MSPIEKLKAAGDDAPRLCIIATGAGAGLQQSIWVKPGISKFFVGSMMPYDTEETVRILGFTPEKWVSEDTAVDLALAAYMRAYKPGKRNLGIGMTCSVTSERKRRGEHRIIVAAFTENACFLINLLLPKGDFWPDDREKAGLEPLDPEVLKARIERKRLNDGKLADELALHLLDAMLGGVQVNNFHSLCESFMNEQLPDIEVVSCMPLARTRILARPFFRADGSRGTLADIDFKDTVEYPGAYNPPHAGHHGAAKASMKTLAKRFGEYRGLLYSTATTHPIKGPMTSAEMLQRAVMMRGYNFLLTENDALYMEKVRARPGADFIMGADALDRLLDPKWGIEPADIIKELAARGTRILVPGRLVDGVFMTCEEVLTKRGVYPCERDSTIYPGDIFIAVDFRLDLSSTELRAAHG